MLYEVSIKGLRPILMHSSAGIDEQHPTKKAIKEITERKPRTESDNERIAELECQLSLWHNGTEVAIPPSAIRATIEAAARKSKEGPLVREGMIVSEVGRFEYDRQRYGETLDELGKSTQHRVPVVVNRGRIIRTRAKFDEWAVSFVLDCDDELIDMPRLEKWLDIAGRRIGLGDWRPACSGDYGRFAFDAVIPVSD